MHRRRAARRTDGPPPAPRPHMPSAAAILLRGGAAVPRPEPPAPAPSAAQRRALQFLAGSGTARLVVTYGPKGEVPRLADPPAGGPGRRVALDVFVALWEQEWIAPATPKPRGLGNWVAARSSAVPLLRPTAWRLSQAGRAALNRGDDSVRV